MAALPAPVLFPVLGMSVHSVGRARTVGWSEERGAVVAKIAVVRDKPKSVVYGPLRDMPMEPSVILLRLNGKQQMLLHDAWPTLRFEGKPQCHIIPIAEESGEIAVSVGCMLSRVRTGMSNNEVTCAIPASRVSLLIERLRAARVADNAVAAYAAEDSKRFALQP